MFRTAVLSAARAGLLCLAAGLAAGCGSSTPLLEGDAAGGRVEPVIRCAPEPAAVAVAAGQNDCAAGAKQHS